MDSTNQALNEKTGPIVINDEMQPVIPIALDPSLLPPTYSCTPLPHIGPPLSIQNKHYNPDFMRLKTLEVRPGTSDTLFLNLDDSRQNTFDLFSEYIPLSRQNTLVSGSFPVYNSPLSKQNTLYPDILTPFPIYNTPVPKQGTLYSGPVTPFPIYNTPCYEQTPNPLNSQDNLQMLYYRVQTSELGLKTPTIEENQISTDHEKIEKSDDILDNDSEIQHISIESDKQIETPVVGRGYLASAIETKKIHTVETTRRYKNHPLKAVFCLVLTIGTLLGIVYAVNIAGYYFV